MELTLCNHSSYPRIGDDPEHQLLRRTIAQRDKGEKTEEAVRAAQERMTELALAEQSGGGPGPRDGRPDPLARSNLTPRRQTFRRADQRPVEVL